MTVPEGAADAPAVDAPENLSIGQLVEVDIGAVAHGGHCVARLAGRVIFVRHALPGERAVVRLTEVRAGSFCRGDAVEIITADPERIAAPCSHFHPGGCGGCDFQHASLPLQRQLKARVVAEQLRRLAGLELAVDVEELDESRLPETGFGWRTRVRWALDEAGRIGPRAIRSHRVEGIGVSRPCLIAAPGLSELAATTDVPPEVRRPASRPPARGRRTRRPQFPEVVLIAAPDGSRQAVWPGQQADIVTEHAVGRDFSVAGDGFWQVHPAAAEALAGAVAEGIAGIQLTGGSAWDLYGGVGLFAEVLATAVAPGGSVVSVEGDRQASALAAGNLADRPWVTAATGDVAAVVATLPDRVDAIVLDPPRTGAGPALCAELAARRPAVIVYVACDPAALGRDVAALAAAGYRLDTLRAFDCFPQTHHVECVARLVPVG